MLRISMPIGNDLLEIHRYGWKGIDEIRWNGEVMSRKKRFFTSKHTFSVTDEYGEVADFYVRVGAGLNGTSYGIKRNGKVLLGTWRDQLTHVKREKMPETPGLDLNSAPRRRRQAKLEPIGRDMDEDQFV